MSESNRLCRKADRSAYCTENSGFCRGADIFSYNVCFTCQATGKIILVRGYFDNAARTFFAFLTYKAVSFIITL